MRHLVSHTYIMSMTWSTINSIQQVSWCRFSRLIINTKESCSYRIRRSYKGISTISPHHHCPLNVLLANPLPSSNLKHSCHNSRRHGFKMMPFATERPHQFWDGRTAFSPHDMECHWCIRDSERFYHSATKTAFWILGWSSIRCY